MEKAFYQPITQSVIGYLQEADIAVHSEILNLRSSQAACLNILFPLRLDLALAVTVLEPVLPSVWRVIDIEFEYTGPESKDKFPLPWQWMGEPAGGKRGQNRTSIDAAIWWEDSNSRKRLTFVEFKYTERQLGGCGGYASKGNKNRQACRTLDVMTKNPEERCYIAGRSSERTSRRYWEHLDEAGIKLDRLGDVAGCPFMGPFNQLMRQFLLAAYCRKVEPKIDEIDLVILGFEGNESLVQLPEELAILGHDIVSAWNSVIDGVQPLRTVHVEEMSKSISAGDPGWSKYLSLRYGIDP